MSTLEVTAPDDEPAGEQSEVADELLAAYDAEKLAPSPLARVARRVGSLVLAAAVLVYLVSPYGRLVWYRWLQPVTTLRLVPPAPRPLTMPQHRV